jgi:hypothetical protein
MTRLEKLKEVAKDLNETMKLDPPIDVDVESAKELKQAIKEEMETEGGQLFETDVETLKEDTWEYLTDTLSIEPRKAEAAAPPAGASKKSKKIQKEKEEKVGKKAAAKKKAAPTTKKKAAPAKREVDEYGFRPGTKKSEAMKVIAKGKTKYDKLKEKFGGQVDFAIKETKERTGTVVEINEKTQIVSIKAAAKKKK